MKLSIFLIGLFALVAIMTEKSSCSRYEKGEVDGLQRILQSVLNKPEYLSLDHMKQQQILIAFFHILENPNKYGEVIKTIAGKFKKHQF